MDFAALKSRLLELDVACVCDADKNLRTMDGGIRPISTGLKMVGRAHTVVCEEDFLTVIKALSDAQPGDVLVVETRGTRRAVAGELFSFEAKRKGLAGLVVDGAVRDIAQVRTFGFPVYSRSVCPASGTTKRVFDTQVPVLCGGLVVQPGDVLFGDDDGIVVASAEHLASLVDAARGIQAVEAETLARMQAGESLVTMLNFDDHYNAVKAGRDSKLKFA